jgi:acetyl-CoA C-acetyltransferase
MKPLTVTVAGVGVTKFGELWNSSPKGLARDAVEEALRDANIEKKEVEALFVGNMLSGMLGGQEHLGALFAEAVGLPTVAACKVEGACASGGLAVHMAVNSILSGEYDTVVVLGVEKMTDHKPEDVAVALTGAGTDEERSSGITFPGLYAMLAAVHMQEFGTTKEQMASVAVKNHYHASFNPKAQFHNLISVDQVLKSSLVADPLHLLDCSPITDGAAALVLTKKSNKKNSVQIKASVVATDSLGLAGRTSLTELSATKMAAKKAYAQAGVDVRDICVAEVHDCFTIAEILALEDLGFFPKGKAAEASFEGKTKLGGGGQIIINPSGGLKGCGHPVGATGVKQIAEIALQLRGEADKRQVSGAKVGLTHNVGGSGATAVVHILMNDE